MTLDIKRTRTLLKNFDLLSLFIEELGWDRFKINPLEVLADGHTFTLTPIAEKRGLGVFLCGPRKDGQPPDNALRRKIEKQVAKSLHEHIIIYSDSAKTTQIWQWVKREPGKPVACREHSYHITRSGEALIQKLKQLFISLSEEEDLTITEVTGRTRKAFDVDRVTKRFYDRFKVEHGAFLKFITGIKEQDHLDWYASVMLNRLMFIYFIQKKSFLDGDINYLSNKLKTVKGKNRFYSDFLLPLFFDGFSKEKNSRTPEINNLLGTIPYLNGGIFLPHLIEKTYGDEITIPDAAFDRLFKYFEQYNWHLDERPLKQGKEINPDVLGYIFEKYINQKQMGAYYTKEDITEYISKNTVIPFLFDEARKKCKIAFEGEQSVWLLLSNDPDRYIYPAVKKGVELPLPQEIAAGIKDVAKRTEWNRPASEEYALPTEIWREVVSRRRRYEEVRAKLAANEVRSINDLITYNLDIRQFAQDVIENSEGPELLRAFWKAINKVTVLDPTCGSGAFLFAALNILEPLYEACLERMQAFIDDMERTGRKHRSEKFADFRKTLNRVEEHPNHKYFVLKSIIINNLYGVDIMEEATEICKLRLFLKLMAQVEAVKDIEPLPDIDFNIRSGNTLVGYASYKEVERAVQGKDQFRIDFGDDMRRIDEKAQIADRAFTLFRKMQTEHGGTAMEFSGAKQELRTRLQELEDELNRYLAGDYGINPNKKTAFDKWLKTHQPFHWFIEFYGIIKNGGFDVIIGNPPYVEYSKIKKDYTVHGYKTEGCGNLYGFVIERSISLLNENSYFSLIVPHSLAATYRSSSIQKLLLSSMSGIFSYYTRRPGKLFEGADQCLCVFVLSPKFVKRDLCPKHFSTTYQRWYTEERLNLFNKMDIVSINLHKYWEDLHVYPKLGQKIESTILEKLSKQKSLRESIATSGNDFYCHRISRYFIKATDFIPYFCSERDGVKRSDDFKVYHALRKPDLKLIVVALNSSLFYWFWRVMFDGYHCGKENIYAFPFEPMQVTTALANLLEKLETKLMKSFIANSKRKSVTYKGSGKVEYDEFNIKFSKPIIDEIDRVLAEHYGFTDEELDFIINYDIKYRMGLKT